MLASTQEYELVTETYDIHRSPVIQDYIEQEALRPNKQWIYSILDGHQEQDEVKMQTSDFILLPDTEKINKYNTKPISISNKKILNWLAIMQVF